MRISESITGRQRGELSSAVMLFRIVANLPNVPYLTMKRTDTCTLRTDIMFALINPQQLFPSQQQHLVSV